jgi:universal stress protein A
MSVISRILCPTDFSETAQLAFDYAVRLASQVQAEIVLLHAFDKPATLTMTGQSIPADPQLQEKLNEMRAALPGVNLKRVLHAGAPGEVICWLAVDRRCDLIVMGTHGHGGLRHFILGSVAEYVVRHARCPVLTTRIPEENEPPPKEPRVLPVPAPRLM